MSKQKMLSNYGKHQSEIQPNDLLSGEKNEVLETNNQEVEGKCKKIRIGSIPEGWETTVVSEIAEFSKGKRSPRSYYCRSDDPGAKPYIRIVDFGKKGVSKYTRADWCLECEETDILIATDGSVGISDFGRKGVLTHHITRIRPNKSRIVPFYLYNFIRMYEKYFLTQKTGVASPTLRQGAIKNLQIPLPPLPEQLKIAAILFSVDSTIQKTQSIVEQAQKLKRGLMQRLLTKGIGHTKFKKTEIGEIPEEWNAKTLKEVARKFISGGTPDTSKKEYWDGDIPWITGVSVTQKIVSIGERYITRKGLENSATNVVPRGSILLVTRTDVGKVAKAGTDIAISQDLTGIVLDRVVAGSDYVVWYLHNNTKKLKRVQQGTTIQGILREDVENFKIAIPPLLEQQKIASILSSINEKIEKEQHYITHLEHLKKGLMQNLLTGKIRVKV